MIPVNNLLPETRCQHLKTIFNKEVHKSVRELHHMVQQQSPED